MTLNVKPTGNTMVTAGTGYKAGDTVNLGVAGVTPGLVKSDRSSIDPFNPAINTIMWSAATSQFILAGDNGLLWTGNGNLIQVPNIPAKMHFSGLAYGNGIYVATTRKYFMMTSTDTITWAESEASVHSYVDVDFGNGVFVALNDQGESFVSTDGLVWQSFVIQANARFNSIKFGAGVFVAVGVNGKIFTSANGVTWVDRSIAASLNTLVDVAYSADLSMFVAVGYNTSQINSGCIYSSPTGTTWTLRSFPSTVSSGGEPLYSVGTNLVGLTSVQGFMAGGKDGKLVVSTNGTTWTSMTLTSGSMTADVTAISNDYACYIGGTHSVVKQYSNSTLTDVNTAGTAVQPIDLYAFKKVGSTIVGSSGVGQTVESTNGTAWTISSEPAFLNPPAIAANLPLATVDPINDGSAFEQPDLTNHTEAPAFNGTRYVKIVSGQLQQSPDNINYTPCTVPVSVTYNQVKFANGIFMAVGASGAIIQSTDGLTWSVSTSVSTGFVDVASSHGGNRWVAIANDNSIYTTNQAFNHNGLSNWVPARSNATHTLRKVCGSAIADRFVAVGDSGEMVASYDAGATWSKITIASTADFNNIAFMDRRNLGGIWVATMNDGSIWSAQDTLLPTNLVFTKQPTITTVTNLIVASEDYNGHIAGVGSSVSEGTIVVTTVDGVTWTKIQISPTATTVNDLQYSPYGGWIMVGDGGFAWISGDSISWTDCSFVAGPSGNYAIRSCFYSMSNPLDGDGWVAVGDHNSIYFTDDFGVGWRLVPNNFSSTGIVNYSKVINGGWYAAGSGPNGTGIIGTDSTGTTFLVGFYGGTTSGTFPYTTGAQLRMTIAPGAAPYKLAAPRSTSFSGFVVYSASTRLQVWQSRDATTLKAVSYQTTAQANNWNLTNVDYVAPSWVVSVDRKQIMATDFTKDWLRQATNIASSFNSVKRLNGIFVLVANGGVLATSPDAITWTTRSTSTTDNLIDVFAWRGLSLVTNSVGKIIVTSLNGSVWNHHVVNSIKSINSGYAYVANGGVYASSADGVTWSLQTTGVSVDLTDVFFARSVYWAMQGVNVVAATSSNQTTWFANTLSYPKILGSTYIAYGTSTLQTSTDGLTWTVKATGASNLSAIYTRGGLYFVYGDSIILTSTDGVTWATSAAGGSGHVNGISYVNSTYVAFGSNGLLATSSNGTTWSFQTSGVTSNLSGVLFDSPLYVVYTDAKDVASISPNGTAWTGFASAKTYAILFSQYFVAGASGLVMTSPDALTWTTRTSGTTATLRAISFSGTRLVIGGDASAVTTSTDYINFVASTVGSVTGSKPRLYGIAPLGQFLIAGSDLNTISLTRDGITWNPTTGASMPACNAITYSPALNLYAAVGDAGSIFTSPDMISWTSRNSTTAVKLVDVEYGPAGFIVTGDNSVILKSVNGITWTSTTIAVTVQTTDIRSVAYDGSTFLYGIGTNNYLTTSTNGTTFSPSSSIDQYSSITYCATSGATGYFYLTKVDGRIVRQAYASGLLPTESVATDSTIELKQVIFVQNTTLTATGASTGLFVAIGKAGKVMTSPDGIVFTSRPANLTANLNAIVYGTAGFAVVGDGGLIATSSNLLDWTVRTSSTSNNLNSIVTFAFGLLTAVGNNGTIRTSSDGGVTWVARTSGVTATLRAIYQSSGTYVTVGDAGTILQSLDLGVSWSTATNASSANMFACTYAFGKWLAFGENETIRTSTTGVTWSAANTPLTPPTPVQVDFKRVAYSSTTGLYQIQSNAIALNHTTNASVLTSPDGIIWIPATVSPLRLYPKYVIATSITTSKDMFGNNYVMTVDSGLNAMINTVDGSGNPTSVTVQTTGLSSQYAKYGVTGPTAASSTGVLANMTLSNSTIAVKYNGRVNNIPMASTVSPITTAITGDRFQGQIGHRTISANTTGGYVLVEGAATPGVVSNLKPVGTNLLGTNMESIPSGAGFGRFTCQSVFPKKQDTTLPYAASTVNLVNTITGVIEFTFPYSFAKISADSTNVVCSKNNGPSDTEIAFYVKISGVWTKTWSVAAGALISDLDFSATSKDTIVINHSSNGIKVYKRDAGLNTFTDQGYVIGTGYIDFSWTRASDSTAFTHGIVLARSGFAPYGDVHVSADGTKVCAMAMAHKKTGSSYAVLDNDNFSPYPTIYDISTSTVSVYRPIWIDFTATHSGKTFKLATNYILPVGNFYNGDISCFTYDIKDDFSTVMFASKPNAPGNAVLNINISHRPSGVASNTGLQAVTHVSTLQSETYYPIKVCPVGTRYAIGGMGADYNGWVRIQGVLTEAATYSRTITGAYRYGMALVFSKNGSNLFAGEPSYNRVTTGTGGAIGYTWTIYSFVPGDRGANINSMTISFSGGSAISQCPNITMAGVGSEQKMTSYWPAFTPSGGGQYVNPSTITINVVSIT